MRATDDAALLLSFARNRDETAFRTLTERHLGLIFHAALRRTGNRPMAEEVTQNVLCAVVRKAGELARHPERLQAWLHRATLFESSKAMRMEASHQRRKQLQHPDEFPGDVHPEEESAWRAALPHLDLALDELAESDRQVVLMHFFERQTFPKIAAALGRSPAAVQKQSVRALEKLSRLLRSKGVAVPARMLPVGMAMESAKAAPAGLLPRLTTNALLKGSTAIAVPGLPLTLALSLKIAAGGVLLILAVQLGLQQMAISQAEGELALLRAHPPGLLQPRSRPPAIGARFPPAWTW